MGMRQIWKTALTANDSSAKEPLGAIREEPSSTYGNKYYMYVKVDASSTIANGTVVVPTTTTGYGYTVGYGTLNAPGRKRAVGVGIGAITASYYGWIQIRGHHTAVKKHLKYSCTQHMANMVYVCGVVRGRRSNYDGATSSNVLIAAGFVPYTTKTSACTTVSGFICMW